MFLNEPNIDYRRQTVKSEDYFFKKDSLSFIDDREIWIHIDNQSLKSPFFKPKERDYCVEVNGEKVLFPIILKHIALRIEEGKEILKYEDDWDDEDAIASDINTFTKAVHFILQYSKYVYNHFSTVLTAPYIDILRDGSVSVHWESAKNSQLLIIFKKEEGQLAYFYAVQGDRKIPFKSAIIPGEAVDETLASWMKNYLH